MAKSHMRLPNGFGQITKIKKPLRNPYRAMVTVDKTEEGRPICKLLKPKAYFPTYNDAYRALMEYHDNPYDLDPGITLKEMYEKWLEEYKKKTKSDSSIRTITSAWAYCGTLYSMPVKQIRARHLKGCIEDSKGTVNTKFRMKSLFNLLFDYAVEYELTDRNYARAFGLSDTNKVEKEHLAFTDDEMKILWDNSENIIVKMILIQCYTGLRPQELVLIENINIHEKYIVGGIKTDAGRDRVIPIHSKISKFINEFKSDSKYLFNGMTYDKFYKKYKAMINLLKLNPDHRPHDPRKTFITNAKKYNMDEYTIKRIVGHAIQDVTEKIYTERDIDWLCKEIEKIKGPV